MKKIIIFGTSGNIGKYMVDYFLEHLEGKYELIGADLTPNSYVEQRISVFQVDINNKDSFSQLPSKDVYAVIDLIGPMPARMNGYKPEVYVKTNVLGSFQVFQYAISSGADRILYAKSFADILMNSENDPVLRIDTPPLFDYDNYHSVYTVTQNTAAELLKCLHGFYGIKAFIFRMPNVYFWSKNDTYNVAGKPVKIMFRELIDQATAGKAIEVWGDASRKKDMLYAKDVCQLFFRACFVDREFGYYNAGTGIGTTRLDQIQGIIEVFCEEKKSEIVLRPDKQNAPQYIMDISEAVEELGYKPEYTYIKMLHDMKNERKLGRY